MVLFQIPSAVNLSYSFLKCKHFYIIIEPPRLFQNQITDVTGTKECFLYFPHHVNKKAHDISCAFPKILVLFFFCCFNSFCCWSFCCWSFCCWSRTFFYSNVVCKVFLNLLVKDCIFNFFFSILLF